MDKITDSLKDTLLSSYTDSATKAIGELSVDLTEITVDTLINNEYVKELPVIKTLLIFPKAIRGISSYLLLQKIIRFIFQLKDTTTEERRMFLSKLEGKKREEILSCLILALDKFDHLNKSDLLGKLFETFIKGKINYEEYMSLIYSLNLIDVNTIPYLVNFYTVEPPSTSIRPEIYYNLVFLRLIRIDNSKIGTWDGGGPEYKRNRLGMLFVEICAGVKIPKIIKINIQK